MRCNKRIQLDKRGLRETYCQLEPGHQGDCSIIKPRAVHANVSVSSKPLPFDPVAYDRLGEAGYAELVKKVHDQTAQRTDQKLPPVE